MNIEVEHISNTSSSYRLRNKIKNEYVNKMVGDIKDLPAVKGGRVMAFASVRFPGNSELVDVLENLGAALNLRDQPAEFQALFDAAGHVKPGNERKFAYISFLDRKEGRLVSNIASGLNVPNANIPAVFGMSTNNLKENNTLRTLYNGRKKAVFLSKGKATQLLKYLLGSASPLRARGVEYVLLHAADRSLTDTYYARIFGFHPLLGIPSGSAEGLGVSLRSFPTLAAAPAPYDEFGVKQVAIQWARTAAYLRKIGNSLFTLFESETAGPVMYKKLDPVPVPAPAAAAGEGGSRKTRRVKRQRHAQTPKRRVK